MRHISLFSLLLILSIFTSCSNSSKDDTRQPPVVSNHQSTADQSVSTEAAAAEQPGEGEDSEVIAPDKWNHPAKEILSKYQVKVLKVELLKGKTYPIFHVELPKQTTKENEKYFNDLTNELSKANGYWDYQLKDVKSSTVIDVECDKGTKRRVWISINGDKNYFLNLQNNTPEKTNVQISDISRSEAGLTLVTPLDFSAFSINSRIKELLISPSKYENRDYRDGIVQYTGLLICERFKDNIIQNIKIGTEIETVKEQLGKPNIIEDGYIFYKTKDYYLGFKGEKNVECAYLCPYSQDYDKDILKLTVERLKSNSSNLMETVNDNKLREFYDNDGHIHGGGWYANSSFGIEIVQFDENSITVYNNFEGRLFQVKDFDYKISFENKDYRVKKAINHINSYEWGNKEFNEEGVLSPSGKLKAKFFWGNSDTHFFTIRTLDNSRPDINVNAPAGEYRWLTDDYILYMNAWTFAPYVVRISNDSEQESINVMYQVGVFPKDDMFQDSEIYLKLKDVKNNIITFYVEELQKEYKVEYAIDSSKKIHFKLKN